MALLHSGVMNTPTLLRLSLLPLAVALSACESKLNIDLATSGFDTAEAVTVRIEGVELRDAGGSLVRIEMDEPREVNLVDLSGGELLRLVEDEEVSARNYQGLRLILDDDEAEVRLDDGTEVPLRLSGDQPFAPISFRISEDSEDSTSLLATLDLRFSLTDQQANADRFLLQQSLTAVDRDSAGSLRGSIDSDYVSDGECAGAAAVDGSYAVYLYAGQINTPTDFFATSSNNPLASASVFVDGENYRYAFPELAPGQYTLAFTCEADLENPQERDALSFREPVTVQVRDGDETRRDF